MNRNEIKNNIYAVKDYSTFFQKLKIADTYYLDGLVYHFINRWNPLLYVYIVILLIILPFYCLFTTLSIPLALKEIVRILITGKV